MHFMINADGYQRVVAHTFVSDNEYLGSDTVFGVKQSLIQQFTPNPDGTTLWQTEFDFVLTPS